MLIDPVALVVEILTQAGWSNVHPDVTDQTERISSEALYGDDYIWVEEDIGTTPHAVYADRPAIRVILYSAEDGRNKARRIQNDLTKAYGTKYTNGGIHRLFTLVRPYRQDITGIPPGVVRITALYELIVSTTEKWN